MRWNLVMSVLIAAFSGACGSIPSKPPGDGEHVPTREAQAKAKEWNGVFRPASYSELSIWPAAYSGEMLLIEVLAHGSLVKQGDVVARLETRAIDEEIHQAELESASAAIRHAGLIEKNAIDEQAGAGAVEHEKAELERARRSLEGWRTRELEFARRSDEIEKQQIQNGIDDQKDELGQLEAMYKADELVDATEEIVLKRSKRGLALSQVGQQLQRDRRQFEIEFNEARQLETREQSIKMQSEALDRTLRTQAIEARARADAAHRSQDALALQNERVDRLRRDRELLTIRAPRDGVLLHGASKDYRAGATTARYERGNPLALHTDLFLVAEPEVRAVALDIDESALSKVKDGAQVTVESVARPGEKVAGVLHIDAWSAKGATREATSLSATVELERPLAGARYGMHAGVHLGATDKDMP